MDNNDLNSTVIRHIGRIKLTREATTFGPIYKIVKQINSKHSTFFSSRFSVEDLAIIRELLDAELIERRTQK